MLRVFRHAAFVFIFASAILSLEACSTRAKNPPTLAQATSLKGLRRERVEERIGKPSDTDQHGRVYWVLSEDSTYHPEPRTRIYEFVFREGRLAEIQPR